LELLLLVSGFLLREREWCPAFAKRNFESAGIWPSQNARQWTQTRGSSWEGLRECGQVYANAKKRERESGDLEQFGLRERGQGDANAMSRLEAVHSGLHVRDGRATNAKKGGSELGRMF